MPLLITKTFMV